MLAKNILPKISELNEHIYAAGKYWLSMKELDEPANHFITRWVYDWLNNTLFEKWWQELLSFQEICFDIKEENKTKFRAYYEDNYTPTQAIEEIIAIHPNRYDEWPDKEN